MSDQEIIDKAYRELELPTHLPPNATGASAACWNTMYTMGATLPTLTSGAGTGWTR